MGSAFAECWCRILRFSWFGHQSRFDCTPAVVRAPCVAWNGHLLSVLMVFASSDVRHGVSGLLGLKRRPSRSAPEIGCGHEHDWRGLLAPPRGAVASSGAVAGTRSQHGQGREAEQDGRRTIRRATRGQRATSARTAPSQRPALTAISRSSSSPSMCLRSAPLTNAISVSRRVQGLAGRVHAGVEVFSQVGGGGADRRRRVADRRDGRRWASPRGRPALVGHLRAFTTPVRLVAPTASRRRGATVTLAGRKSAKSRGSFRAAGGSWSPPGEAIVSSRNLEAFAAHLRLGRYADRSHSSSRRTVPRMPTSTSTLVSRRCAGHQLPRSERTAGRTGYRVDAGVAARQ